MVHFLKSLFRRAGSHKSEIDWINQRRQEFSKLHDTELRVLAARARDLLEIGIRPVDACDVGWRWQLTSRGSSESLLKG